MKLIDDQTSGVFVMSSEEDIKCLVDHVAALKVGEERSSNQDICTLADWMSSGKTSKILVLSGAGVSVAAGIPDFRCVDGTRKVIVLWGVRLIVTFSPQHSRNRTLFQFEKVQFALS